jgi:hypothetical protein
VGLLALARAALGVAAAVRPGRRHVLVSLLVWGSLMLGNLGPLAPFSLLHQLPVYDSLRVPSRFAVLVGLQLALLAAHGCELLRSRIHRPRLAWGVGAALGCAVCVDLLSASWPLAGLWREPPLSSEPPAAVFQLVKRNYQRFYASYPRLNLGTPICYVGGMSWPVSRALWLGPSAQLRVEPGAGHVSSWSSSPNGLRAEVELSRPARVVANRNFAEGFRSNLGTPLADDGRLAVDLPAGRHSLELRYRPSELLPSAAVSGVGLLGLAWLLRARRPRKP